MRTNENARPLSDVVQRIYHWLLQSNAKVRKGTSKNAVSMAWAKREQKVTDTANKIISCNNLSSKLGERDAAIRCRLALMHSGCRIDDAARRNNHVRGIGVFECRSDLFFCGLSITIGRDHGLALGPEGRGGGG